MSNILSLSRRLSLAQLHDSYVNFDEHIKNICRIALYYIRNIAKIRKFLSYDTAKNLMHAFFTSRIDSCNALLFGLPNFLIQRSQYVLNSAARGIPRSRKFDHITPLLIELHWLRVEQRIIFKILLFTFKVINTLAPSYLSELLDAFVPMRLLNCSCLSPNLILRHMAHMSSLFVHPDYGIVFI